MSDYAPCNFVAFWLANISVELGLTPATSDSTFDSVSVEADIFQNENGESPMAKFVVWNNSIDMNAFNP